VEPLADQYAHPADLSQAELDNHALQKTAPLPKRLYRGRPGVIVLTALLVEIVVIAGIGNQWVSKQLQNYLSDHPGAADYTRGAVQAALTFHWRFAPANGQSTHVWAAQLAAIGTLLLLSGLLIWVVSRGSVTFGRIWVAVGAIVAALTPIAVMVGNAIIVPNAPGPGQSRLGQAVYGYTGYGPAIVGGLVLGVVTGLLCGLLAVITRRSVPLPAPVDPAVAVAPLNAYGVPTPGYEPPPWQAPEAAFGEGAPTAYIPPYEDLPADRGPLDHLGASAATTVYPPVAAAAMPVPEQPAVTTAESAAVETPTQSMHIDLTQPEIVLAEDSAGDSAEGSATTAEDAGDATQPPVPPAALDATESAPTAEAAQTHDSQEDVPPPVPTHDMEPTQPPVPPERVPADDMDELELDEHGLPDAQQEESTGR
jgi:hypothetical protein